MPDDLDTELGNGTGPSDGKGGGLRAQLEAALAREKALSEKFDQIQAAQRQRDLDGLFEKHKIPAKAKAFFPKEGELDDKAALAFLDEFGELWGHTSPDATTPPADQVAATRVHQVSAEATQTNLKPLTQQDYADRFAAATDLTSLKQLMSDEGVLAL
jgi:alpha-ketoglutarate-dependent taurine dioxygenase